MIKKFIELVSNRSEHIKNFSWRALQLVSRQGISLIITLITAKLLPTEDFGIYSYLVATIVLLTLIADFGISRAIAKFAAEFKSQREEELNLLFFNSGIILTVIVFLAVILVLLFNNWIAKSYGRFLIYLLPVLIFLPATSLYDGILSGLKEFKKISILSLISAGVALASAFPLIMNYEIIGAFLALDIFYTLLFILMAFNFNLYCFKFNKEIFALVGKYSFIIGLSSLGHFLYSRAATLILGKFEFYQQAGYFELNDRLFMLISYAFIIAGQVISPRITELYFSGGRNQVKELYKKFSGAVILIGLIITLAAYFVIPLFIKIFFNQYYVPEFLEMFNMLILILPFTIYSGFFSQPFIIGTGHAKLSLLTIPFGILHIVLGLMFLNIWGPIGVIIALVIASVSNKLIVYTYLFKKL